MARQIRIGLFGDAFWRDVLRFTLLAAQACCLECIMILPESCWCAVQKWHPSLITGQTASNHVAKLRICCVLVVCFLEILSQFPMVPGARFVYQGPPLSGGRALPRVLFKTKPRQMFGSFRWKTKAAQNITLEKPHHSTTSGAPRLWPSEALLCEGSETVKESHRKGKPMGKILWNGLKLF